MYKGWGKFSDPHTSLGSIFFCIYPSCLFPTLYFFRIVSKESNVGLYIYDYCHLTRFRPLFYLSELLESLFCHFMYSLYFLGFFFFFILPVWSAYSQLATKVVHAQYLVILNNWLTSTFWVCHLFDVFRKNKFLKIITPILWNYNLQETSTPGFIDISYKSFKGIHTSQTEVKQTNKYTCDDDTETPPVN